MKQVTIKELQENLELLLAEVHETNQPLLVVMGESSWRILPEKRHKLQNLIHRPDVIRGDPEELVTISWDVSLDID